MMIHHLGFTIANNLATAFLGYRVHHLLQIPIMAFHELGHAAAADLLFKEAHPRIIFNEGYQGAKTIHLAKDLSKMGEKMGRAKSFMLISAAGPLAEILLANSVPMAVDAILPSACTRVFAVAFAIELALQVVFREFDSDLIKISKESKKLSQAITLLRAQTCVSLFKKAFIN